ncbi:expressed unknown protein [Seminavis robusta]|uniref:Uncharacterized protein n=1 Tax=Seminavis robusta TaxID=568900 RepID=A0A9N8HJK7_9STRA|nr:expressed unknown protein [Seminavis robusta]|eukprot:Sro772_g200280.1 n/a (219) ;mRNA; r:26299-26955
MQIFLDLNNGGIAFLQTGQAEKALECFHRAFVSLRNETSKNQSTGLRAVQANDLAAGAVPVPVSDPSAGAHLYCSRAFGLVIPPSRQRLTEVDTEFCGSVINYNIAITLQLYSVHHGSSQVFSLYKKCLKALESLSYKNDGFVDVSRMTVACLFNMSNLLLDQDELGTAASFVSLAQQLLLTNEDQPCLFDDETMQAFSWAAYFVPYCASLGRSAPAA